MALKSPYGERSIKYVLYCMDVLGGWSEETEISVQSLVGRKTTHENAEGRFIGDAQYCKNFQSSNMMMLISRLID